MSLITFLTDPASESQSIKHLAYFICACVVIPATIIALIAMLIILCYNHDHQDTIQSIADLLKYTSYAHLTATTGGYVTGKVAEGWATSQTQGAPDDQSK